MEINNPYSKEELLATDSSHAVLGASGYERWAGCPGSVILTHGLPNESSFYAEQGTAAHELGEICLNSGTDAVEHIGIVLNTFEVDSEMAGYVQVYLDLCRGLPAQYRRVEVHSDYSAYVPEGSGTADYMCIGDETLHIIDFKYGQGVRVEVHMNGQLLLYALGIYLSEYLLWNLKTITITICQPRADNIRSFSIEVADLLIFAEETKARADRIFEERVALVPGADQCRFCGVNNRCPAIEEQMQEELEHEFDDLDEETHLIDNQHLATILPMLDLWQTTITRYRELAHDQLTQGNDVGEWKLVIGRRGNRAWIDATEAAVHLKKSMNDDPMKHTLLTPTQIMKLCGLKKGMPEYDEFVEALTFQPDGSAVLAPGDDPRPALQSYADDFKDESNERTKNE